MRVGVAISGGMDSAASAIILKNEGRQLIPLHMKLFDDCRDSLASARRVAEIIGEPLHVIDLVEEFRTLVIDYFVRDYGLGRTPSPCPRCNRFIKLDLLAKHAWNLGCEKIATGHYARITTDEGRPTLLKGLDPSKDQSYFLFMLTPEILERTLFPLGAWKKSDVRDFVGSMDLALAQKEESQELCFVENHDYVSFLRKMGIEERPGPIFDTEGNLLGQHNGIINYTVGQRRGLGVCGPHPRYVIRIEPENNSIVIGLRDHTFSNGALISDLNIIRPDLARSKEFLKVKIRSTSKPVDCRIVKMEPNRLEFEFLEPQSSVAPGQAAVFYLGAQVVMGGWIEKAIRK